MKKLTLLTAASLFLFSAYSQNDSTRLDVGGVVLKRAFTQNVTIKGEDLEKMPFATLSEAINVWLYGAYTDPGYITYVVDGNVVSEVNTYSIHDIEEVVLVQNAAALNSLSSGQPQMVVITTRKGKGKSGIQAAAQTFLVKNAHSAANLYHQYYAGAYQNLDKISFGLSANYLRDVDPIAKMDGLHVSTPNHMDRWRLNGYFLWRPDSRNTIEVHAGFTPQTIGSEADYSLQVNPTAYDIHYKTHAHTNLFLPRARWHAEWLPGLRNDLQAGVLTEQQKGNYWSLDAPVDTNFSKQYTESNTKFHSDHVYVRERLSYEVRAGGWNIEPSFNASYEHFKYGYTQSSINVTGRNIGPGHFDLGNVTSVNSYWTGSGANLYILTPAVDISYKRFFNLQGGIVANVSNAKGQKGVKRIFPFASTTVDLLRLGNTQEHGSSLKLFGSYAQRGGFVLNDYMLNDLSNMNGIFNSSLQPGGVWTGTGAPVVIPGSPIKTFWVWQLGTSFTSRDSRWQLSYNFERLNFPTFGQFFTPGGSPTYVYSKWSASRHFLGLQVRLVDKGAFSWRSGVTTTVIRNKSDAYAVTYTYPPLGDYVAGNKRPSWTGGWTHRIQYKDLSFGIDMLYHFSREVSGVLPNGAAYFSRTNTFLLQNIYVGYRLHLPGKTGLEIYADSRGLVRSSVIDDRRYYGVGGKITI